MNSKGESCLQRQPSPCCCTRSHACVSDFYDAHMRLILVRFLRPEANFDSMEALIKAISADVEAAQTQLEEEGVRQLGQEPFLLQKEGPRL